MTEITWDNLTEAQRRALIRAQEAFTRHQANPQSPNWVWGNAYGEVHKLSARALVKRGLMNEESVGCFVITDLGRAVFEAGQAGQVAPFPSTPDDHTYIPGLWRVTSTPLPGHPETMVESYELVSENADELADLRAQLATAQQERDDLRAALENTVNHIEKFRNSVHMPPTVYAELTDITLRIHDVLRGISDKEDSVR